jgi:hypothetical protein
VRTLRFPQPFVHAHPPVRSVNESELERLTVGQRAADRVAAVIGSWRFIISRSVTRAGGCGSCREVLLPVAFE